MKTYLQKSQNLLNFIFLTFGLMITIQAQSQTIPSANVALSGVIYKEKSGNVELTPTTTKQRVVATYIAGDGDLSVSGTLTTIPGACARIKISIVDGLFDNFPLFHQGTWTVCGSRQISLSKFLNYTQDDDDFSVHIENIDAWNQTSINGNLTFRYPTASRILTGISPTKFDLQPGNEVNQQFILSPNKPGKLTVKVVYSNNAKIRVTLKTPKGSIARPPVEGTSGLTFTYDVTETDTTGENIWTVNVSNISLTQAVDASVSVIFIVKDTYL